MLIELNLLPWREQLKTKNRQQMGLIALLALFVSSIFLFFYHVRLVNRIAEIAQINDELRVSRFPVSPDIQKLSINMRQDQQSILNFFHCLGRADDQYIYLNKMLEENKIIYLSGDGQSSDHIAQFIKNLKNCSRQVNIIEMHNRPQINFWQFQLKIML